MRLIEIRDPKTLEKIKAEIQEGIKNYLNSLSEEQRKKAIEQGVPQFLEHISISLIKKDLAKMVEEQVKHGDAIKIRRAIRIKDWDTTEMVKFAFQWFFSFLNEKCQIKEGERFYPFLKEVRKLEKKLLGLKPAKCLIKEYSSGKKCIYDAVFSVMEELRLWPLITGQIERAIEDPSLRPSIFRRVLTPFLYFKFRAVAIYLSKIILGQYDLIDWVDIPVGEVRIVVPNIIKIAGELKYNIGDLEKFVVIHEEVHNTQVFNAPELNKRRKELAQNLFRLVKDKSSQEKSREELEALMTTIEGHAEFFAKKIAEILLPNFKYERKKPDFRERIKLKILGMGQIKKRYLDGAKFIEALYKKGGNSLANLPLKIPPKSKEEIEKPEKYLERINKR